MEWSDANTKRTTPQTDHMEIDSAKTETTKLLMDTHNQPEHATSPIQQPNPSVMLPPSLEHQQQHHGQHVHHPSPKSTPGVHAAAASPTIPKVPFADHRQKQQDIHLPQRLAHYHQSPIDQNKHSLLQQKQPPPQQEHHTNQSLSENSIIGHPKQPQKPQHHFGGDHHPLSQAFQTYLKHDREEQAHWHDVCQAYRQYATFALCCWSNQRHRLDALPESQRNVLPDGLRINTSEYCEREKQYKDAAIRNQFCLDCILRHAGMPHSQQKSTMKVVADGQISKVSSVLKSLSRDWSLDGKAERDMAYSPILQQVQRSIPIPVHKGKGNRRASPPKLCVPGAGVGRLALELAALGYAVQGNEFSLFMLLASDFVLNSGVTPEKPLVISPWLLETRNVHGATDPMRKVVVPDVDPQTFLSANQNKGKGEEMNDGTGDDGADDEPEFSMAAGDFVSIYTNPREYGQWDGVISCFFLDAAPSVIEFVQIIHRILKHGGVFINFGPLLYHWSGPAMRPDDRTVQDYQTRFSHLDRRYMVSVDLCWADFRQILINVGFEILEEKVGVRSLYTADRKSMMNMAYRCINFVAKKVS